MTPLLNALVAGANPTHTDTAWELDALKAWLTGAPRSGEWVGFSVDEWRLVRRQLWRRRERLDICLRVTVQFCGDAAVFAAALFASERDWIANEPTFLTEEWTALAHVVITRAAGHDVPVHEQSISWDAAERLVATVPVLLDSSTCALLLSLFGHGSLRLPPPAAARVSLAALDGLVAHDAAAVATVLQQALFLPPTPASQGLLKVWLPFLAPLASERLANARAACGPFSGSAGPKDATLRLIRGHLLALGALATEQLAWRAVGLLGGGTAAGDANAVETVCRVIQHLQLDVESAAAREIAPVLLRRLIASATESSLALLWGIFKQCAVFAPLPRPLLPPAAVLASEQLGGPALAAVAYILQVAAFFEARVGVRIAATAADVGLHRNVYLAYWLALHHEIPLRRYVSHVRALATESEPALANVLREFEALCVSLCEPLFTPLDAYFLPTRALGSPVQLERILTRWNSRASRGPLDGQRAVRAWLALAALQWEAASVILWQNVGKLRLGEREAAYDPLRLGSVIDGGAQDPDVLAAVLATARVVMLVSRQLWNLVARLWGTVELRKQVQQLLERQDVRLLERVLVAAATADGATRKSSVWKTAGRFLHAIFTNEPVYIQLLHEQTYPLEAVELAVTCIPSFHVALTYIPALLADADTQRQLFGLKTLVCLARACPVAPLWDVLQRALVPQIQRDGAVEAQACAERGSVACAASRFANQCLAATALCRVYPHAAELVGPPLESTMELIRGAIEESGGSARALVAVSLLSHAISCVREARGAAAGVDCSLR